MGQPLTPTVFLSLSGSVLGTVCHPPLCCVLHNHLLKVFRSLRKTISSPIFFFPTQAVFVENVLHHTLVFRSFVFKMKPQKKKKKIEVLDSANVLTCTVMSFFFVLFLKVHSPVTVIISIHATLAESQRRA